MDSARDAAFATSQQQQQQQQQPRAQQPQRSSSRLSNGGEEAPSGQAHEELGIKQQAGTKQLAEPESKAEQGDYEIEAISGRRLADDSDLAGTTTAAASAGGSDEVEPPPRYLYWVKWLGYGSDMNTWEPIDDFEPHEMALVKAFNDRSS